MSEQNQLNWQRTNLDHIEQAWDGDLWDRKRLGEQLTNYVDRLNCGAVLALDARWGEGKTWFVRHWKKHLEEEQHNVIYLDAFANDYLEDPFLVISSEIASKLDQTADKSLVHKFKKAAAVMQQGLLTQAPTIIASMISFALTGGIIPFLKIDNESIKEKYDDIVNKVTDNIGDKVTEAIQKKIDDYEEEKQSLNAFKETLGKLADSLDRPLVFIIDELDRCHPDFAIRLIERIKHFFDIPKIVFVLVMNKPQLLQSIKSFYGYDSDLNGDYLEKFVDFTIHLPKSSEDFDFKEIIKYQLFRIGELDSLDDTNELFYWALGLQIDKKLNSRELNKKINTFALLRTEDSNKNLILISLIMGQEPYVNYHIYINTVVKKLNAYLCTDKRAFVRRHNLNFWHNEYDNVSESEWYRLILNYELKVENTFINEILNAYESSVGSDDSEYHLSLVMKDVAIYQFDHSNNFIKDWQKYILRGL
ncbi:P-loop ATPase [Acinetobacter defluvii]|uniref:KAP family P-loop NTPase fold protein n=1 Tax=Acinetobacter defluvii TaxID=1871111 RepID=UPI00149036B4|nr:P-loop NTPase fold protein [Acinetobacter defluvii]NNP71561.1 P-loop ATPase [Acinetobacter defluvii]